MRKKYYKYKKGYYRRKRRKNDLIVLLVLLGAGAYYGVDGAGAALKWLITIGGIILITSITIKIYKKQASRARYLNSKIRQIDSMDGIEFERFLCEHFRKQGFKVKDTPASNDYGADLIISKDGVKTVVQAKRYNGKVNNSAVQEIVGAIAFYHADKAMVVTNSYFTKNAVALAEANHVELWDREKLIDTFQIK